MPRNRVEKLLEEYRAKRNVNYEIPGGTVTGTVNSEALSVTIVNSRLSDVEVQDHVRSVLASLDHVPHRWLDISIDSTRRTTEPTNAGVVKGASHLCSSSQLYFNHEVECLRNADGVCIKFRARHIPKCAGCTAYLRKMLDRKISSTGKANPKLHTKDEGFVCRMPAWGSPGKGSGRFGNGFNGIFLGHDPFGAEQFVRQYGVPVRH